MKKIYFALTLLSFTYGNSQVRMTGTIINSVNSSAFIDASSNATNNETVNAGKGIVFPRVDLSTFTFLGTTGIPNNFPGRYDSMIVYNTKDGGTANAGTTEGTLTPGFWFYENKSNSVSGGTWKPLAAGKSILSGTINPITSSGSDGDFYINTATNTIFGPKAGGAWPVTGTSLIGATGANGSSAYQVALSNGFSGTEAQWLASLVGATGSAGANGTAVLNGTINPEAVSGSDGDFYINTATNTIFGPKAGGAWPATGTSLIGATGANGSSAYQVAVSNGFSGTEAQWLASLVGATGSSGANGTAVLNGTINPEPVSGSDGDFYINTATNTIFGPKAGGAWPATGASLIGATGANGSSAYQIAVSNGFSGTEAQWLASLVGAQGTPGKTVLSGNVTPAAETGVAGDFYIDTATNQIFGPKTTTWPAGVSLVGPAGTNATVTADNGLTAASGNIKLGGTLTNPTTIDQDTNTLAFTSNATSGTSHFTVDGPTLSVDAINNRVGVGTSTPSSILHVVANNPTIGSGNGNGDGITIGTSDSTKYAQLRTADITRGEGWPSGGVLELLQSDNTTSSIKLSTGSNSYLGVNTNGNFGIGTTAPTQKLTVSGGNIRIQSLQYEGGTFGQLDFFNTAGFSTRPRAFISAYRDGNADNGMLNFAVASTTDVAPTVAMTINETGNVGIGTTAPTQKLHVNGGALVSSLSGAGNRMVIADENGLLSTQAIPSSSIADGSETKLSAGTNVTLSGNGTTASPYVVNAAGATDATTTTKGIVLLSGDLSGTATNPLIANNAVNSAKIANGTILAEDLNSMSATSGQVLKYNGTVWAPAADAGITATTVSNTIASGALTTTVNGVTSAAVTLPVTADATTTANGSVRLAGDLSGTAVGPTIATGAVNSAKIANGTILAEDLNSMLATSGQVLKYNGTVWAPAADAGITATTVSNTIASGALTTTVNGVTSAAVTLPVTADATTTANGSVRLAGDLSGAAASPTIATGAVNSAKIANATILTEDIANGAITSTLMSGGAGLAGRIPVANATGTITYTVIPTIYTGNGALTENRIVTQNDKTLAFTISSNTGTSHFTVDNTTLNVDAANHRVGIGTNAPISALTVEGPHLGQIMVGNTDQAGAIRFKRGSDGSSNGFIGYDGALQDDVFAIKNSTGGDLSTIAFQVGNFERMRVTPEGLGIGTTNVTRALTIVSNQSSFEQVSIINTGTADIGDSNAGLKLQSTNRNTNVDLVCGTAVNHASRINFLRSNNEINAIILSDQSGLNIRTNGLEEAKIALTIDTLQRVGIGTTTPGSKLAVVGLPVFADNTAASSLSVGDFYRTSTGVVMVRY